MSKISDLLDSELSNAFSGCYAPVNFHHFSTFLLVRGMLMADLQLLYQKQRNPPHSRVMMCNLLYDDG